MKLKEVLIVDDDDVNNFICKEVITKSRLCEKITIFNRPEEGLNYLRNAENQGRAVPDMLLLDIIMPVMDGEDFLSALNSLEEKTRKMKIFIISSTVYENQNNISKKHPEITGYITKPLTLSKLDFIFDKYFKDNFKTA